jgi:hypothetical protein
MIKTFETYLSESSIRVPIQQSIYPDMTYLKDVKEYCALNTKFQFDNNICSIVKNEKLYFKKIYETIRGVIGSTYNYSFDMYEIDFNNQLVYQSDDLQEVLYYLEMKYNANKYNL